MKYVISCMFTAVSAILPLASINGAPQESTNGLRFNVDKAEQAYQWIVWQSTVLPENRKAFDGLVTQIITEAQERPSFLRVLVFFDEPTSTYTFLYPMESLDDFAKVFIYWKSHKDKVDLEKYLESYSIQISKTLPDLSRVPPNGNLSCKDKNFTHIDTVYIKPNLENQFEKLLKEWTSKVGSKDVNAGWFVHLISIGNQLPVYTIYYGDCLSETAGFVSFNQFLHDKQAIGPTVKKIISTDQEYLPELSTAPLVYDGKDKEVAQ